MGGGWAGEEDGGTLWRATIFKRDARWESPFFPPSLPFIRGGGGLIESSRVLFLLETSVTIGFLLVFQVDFSEALSMLTQEGSNHRPLVY